MPAASIKHNTRYQKQNTVLLAVPTDVAKIVLIGDSITERWSTADPDFFRSNSYINRGIGGETTAQILLRFEADVIALKPQIVVILAGINDIAGNGGAMTHQMTMGNIHHMLQLSENHGITAVLCSVLPAIDFPWRSGLQPSTQIIALNQMIIACARQKQLRYVDYYSEMVDDQLGLDRRYSRDGVHPNKKGYRIMAPILVNVLSAIIN